MTRIFNPATLPGPAEGVWFVRTGRLRINRGGKSIELQAGEPWPEAFEVKRSRLMDMRVAGKIDFRYQDADSVKSNEKLTELMAELSGLNAEVVRLLRENSELSTQILDLKEELKALKMPKKRGRPPKKPQESQEQ